MSLRFGERATGPRRGRYVDASRNYEERGAAKMTVEEAARTLGIKEESVRKRVRRGKMRFEKDEDGRLYVYVDGTQTAGGERVDKPEDPYADQSVDESRDLTHELIESKDETIRILQDQLQEEREARRRADTIIAQLTQADLVHAQRMPELEASQVHEEAIQGAAESAAGVHGHSGTGDPLDAVRPRDTAEFPMRGSLTRPWWRRAFGG
jgi:excisionase family DNA binding protein